ncbi:hypothetical protein Clacol_001006 [Clathrus columnatus]|uniref:Uncharacterized protein n=1 Tax=Clathrus columnatus TaxID=1419009 RepID=A0AAV4ZY98_9AGAM|nr:hypothetical protein Clacol_001006 [Clathrus columnatus]
MPNPKCLIAAGRPFYHIFAILFIDDVLGNVSKQWNKHYVCYLSNACLPCEHLDKEFNLCFVGSSPHITALELAQGVCESFKATTTGKIGYDCLNRSECIFRVMPYINAADNPMQAELCSQSGLASNKFCRTCEVGGSQLYKCGDGYLDLFVAGELQTLQKTREIIDGQFTRAMQPRSQTMVESFVKEHGIKDTIAQPLIEHFTRSANELFLTKPNKEKIQSILKQKYDELKKEGNFQNPLLEMPGLNVHLDCPTEILHTVLLGVVKYFWGQTVWLVSNTKKFNIFQMRLESLSGDGLNIPRIMAAYMCQYRGSLIGKHFKTIVQILPLVIYDLIHADLLDAWLLLGRLAVLCWHMEIEDIDMYIEELELVIDQFLTKVAVCAPSIITTKPKFHFLKHLSIYDGLGLLSSLPQKATVWHQVGILQKHLPSLIVLSTSLAGDIGMTNQQGIVLSTREYRDLLGFPKTVMSEPGLIMLISLGKNERGIKGRQSVSWINLLIALHPEFRGRFDSEALFYEGQSIITQNRDVAKLGSAVIVQDAGAVAHIDDNQFVLNTLSLHNHAFIKMVLPKTLAHARIYYVEAQHEVIRLQKAEQVRDKKAQAKELKETMNALGCLKNASTLTGSTDVMMMTNENTKKSLRKKAAVKSTLSQSFTVVQSAPPSETQTTSLPSVTLLEGFPPNYPLVWDFSTQDQQSLLNLMTSECQPVSSSSSMFHNQSTTNTNGMVFSCEILERH